MNLNQPLKYKIQTLYLENQMFKCFNRDIAPVSQDKIRRLHNDLYNNIIGNVFSDIVREYHLKYTHNI